MERFSGFLLSSVRYGDHDAVLHIFTNEKGHQSFFARSVFAPKSRKKSYLHPLSLLSFTSTGFGGNKSMPNISKIERLAEAEFHEDVKAGAILFFTADFLNITLRNEDRNVQIYGEILKFLHQVSLRNYTAHLIFLTQMLRLLGIAPLISEGKFLDPEEGKFTESINHQLFNVETSGLWRQILTSQEAYDLKISQSDRAGFLDSIMLYYQMHLPGFRTPVSLEVVKQIFA